MKWEEQAVVAVCMDAICGNFFCIWWLGHKMHSLCLDERYKCFAVYCECGDYVKGAYSQLLMRTSIINTFFVEWYKLLIHFGSLLCKLVD